MSQDAPDRLGHIFHQSLSTSWSMQVCCVQGHRFSSLGLFPYGIHKTGLSAMLPLCLSAHGTQPLPCSLRQSLLNTGYPKA